MSEPAGPSPLIRKGSWAERSPLNEPETDTAATILGFSSWQAAFLAVNRTSDMLIGLRLVSEMPKDLIVLLRHHLARKSFDRMASPIFA